MTIIQNAIKTPDGTFLRSYHRHDYKTHVDQTNGKHYMVDGGNAYLRRNLNEDSVDLTKYYEECSFEECREIMCWGSRGKNGDQPMTFIPIYKMSNDHIENVLANVASIAPHYKEMFEAELGYRNTHNIVIED